MRWVLFFLLLLFWSCDPCRNLDCAVSEDWGQFRIVNNAGTDLLFGPQKVYDALQIRFYALQGNDTTFFESQAVHFPNGSYDSVLSVRFYTHPGAAYVDLGNGDVDTLQFAFKTVHSRCCGTLTNFTQVRYNNVDLPTTGTQEIKK